MPRLRVLPPKRDALLDIFGQEKPIVGVIHLAPLPGAPRYRGGSVEGIYSAAVRDAVTLTENGVDGVIIENAFDLPFARPESIGPETVAALAVASQYVRTAISLPLGVICVANGVIQALAVAKAVGAKWVRVNQWVNAYVANEGLINGCAGEALRYRSSIRGDEIAIFADVHVKFGAHAITADRSISEQARDAEFFDADVLIVSGSRTGSPTRAEDIRMVKESTSLPVFIGSGLDASSASDLLTIADGAIVGSWLKEDGHWWLPVDAGRVRALMAEVRKLRSRK